MAAEAGARVLLAAGPLLPCMERWKRASKCPAEKGYVLGCRPRHVWFGLDWVPG